MKQVKSIITLVLVAGMLLLFTACNQSDTKQVHNEEKNPDNVAGQVPGNNPETTEMGVEQMLEGETMVFKESVSPQFKNSFNQVVNSYLAMKDGFVQDNEAEIDKQAAQMSALLNRMPDNLLTGEALNYWKEKKGFLMAHLGLYNQSGKDKDKQRSFVFLSTVLVKTVKAFGYSAQPLYVFYCDKANNKKGAYWLNQTKKIQNPYDPEMDECGELKDEL